MADIYVTLSDVYDYGLPRGKLSNQGRLCASVLAATDQFELDEHGFETDAELVFRAEGGGVLPNPIVAGTTYRAIKVNSQFFKAAATAGGAPIDLTTNGDQVVVATPLPFAKVAEFYSRWADDCLIGHAVPLTAPYPPIVVGNVARLTAQALLLENGQRSAALDALELAAKAQLERWARGNPIRDSKATAPTNLAHAEAVLADPRGWGGGTIP